IGLAENGADVVPTGRREQQVNDVCSLIEATGRRTLRHTADATKRASIDTLRDAVLAKFGRVDILVNAAGYILHQSSVTLSEEQWTSMLDTHLTGALRACQSFHEALKASGHGRIINIASLTSFL